MTHEEIIQAIEGMTVLELSELVKALEDKFGVSASAPAMAMPMMMPGAGARLQLKKRRQSLTWFLGPRFQQNRNH